MPKTSFVKRIKKIIVQVGSHVEVFDLDANENITLTNEKRNEKIKTIRQKIDEIENNSSENHLNKETTLDSTRSLIDNKKTYEIKSNDNGQNQMKNELKFDDFSEFNDNEFFFNEDIDSTDYSELELEL